VTPVLSAHALGIGYGGRSARPLIENLNAVVEGGTLVAVFGPNGAGKSSLLRTMAGMQAALSGHVAVEGVRIDRMRPLDRARCLAVVLTERQTVPALTVRRLVEWGRYPHLGWSGRLSVRDHVAVDRALEASGVAVLADRPCETLSDGEYQRAQIARALAQQPRVLILDEPTAFLDAPGRLALMSTLRRLASDDGLAVIVATHDVDPALRAASVVWLVGSSREGGRGRPMRIGTAASLRAAGDLAWIVGEVPLASSGGLGGATERTTCAASAR
jgi:iron complex transport system ATP-binding protein